MSEVTFGNRLLRQGCTDRNWGVGCKQECNDSSYTPFFKFGRDVCVDEK